MPDPDLLVVGGGPAGLAVAIEARLAGLSAHLVDRGRPPLDKACGEGLMPDGLACLHRLGVDLAADELHPFHGIRYLDGDLVAEGRFPGAAGAGIRRTRLHAALVARAVAVGVELEWGVRVEEPRGEAGIATTAGPRQGRMLVAADGLRSPLRHAVGLAGRPSRHRRFGVRRHFALAPWSDLVEVHWAEGCEAYVTPVAADEVGVALLWSGRKASFDELIASFPRLLDRLGGAAAVSRDRGAGPLRQRVRRVRRGRLLLVGDAGGYVDAITGEGLSLAFHQARALVAAVRADDLAAYDRAHRRIGSVADRLTRLLLAVETRPWLRRRMVRALAADPDLFSRILAVHSRQSPLASLGWQGARRLVWGLARA